MICTSRTAHINAAEIVKLAKEAAAKGAKLITFPELCLTGYTCGDLFLQETLLEGALDALNTVCRETAELAAVIVVGLPLRVKGKLYNVAAVVNAGDVLASSRKPTFRTIPNSTSSATLSPPIRSAVWKTC